MYLVIFEQKSNDKYFIVITEDVTNEIKRFSNKIRPFGYYLEREGKELNDFYITISYYETLQETIKEKRKWLSTKSGSDSLLNKIYLDNKLESRGIEVLDETFKKILEVERVSAISLQSFLNQTVDEIFSSLNQTGQYKTISADLKPVYVKYCDLSKRNDSIKPN